MRPQIVGGEPKGTVGAPADADCVILQGAGERNQSDKCDREHQWLRSGPRQDWCFSCDHTDSVPYGEAPDTFSGETEGRVD